MKIFSLMLVLSMLASCSSHKAEDEGIEEIEHDDIQKDYVVTDASQNIRPTWTADADAWAHDKEKSVKKFRFYSYETDPKNSREISCQLANANAKAIVAGEIRTFIQKTLASSQDGVVAIDANNPKSKPLTDYVENTLAEKIEAMIHGAEMVKNYWEKRSYQKDLGAKKDYIGFTCASLIRVPRAELKSAIAAAKEGLVSKAVDEKLKARVKKAMAKIEKDYVEANKAVR